MAPISINPKQNRLLAAIPETEWDRFSPHLTPVVLKLGDVLYESGAHQPYVYFLTDAIVSLLHGLQSNSYAEIAIVGNEGLVGIALFMGGGTTPSRAVVQIAGHGFRMQGKFIRDEFDLAGPVQEIFLRYTQALVTQMGQIAVCNAHHSLGQRLCRWLLMSLDRLPTNELAVTQQLIADRFGVRRESVTEAMGDLERPGLIECKRGLIRVLNRRSLERMACECYEVVRKEFVRLVPSDTSQVRSTAMGAREST